MEVLLNSSPPSPWSVLVPAFLTTISAPEVAWPYSAGIALVSTLISSMPTETELSEVPPSMRSGNDAVFILGGLVSVGRR